MATLYTHTIVGLGLAEVCTRRRMPLLFWVMAGLLPVVPDFDSFSSQPYPSTLGHRGFTHSLLFALVIGLIAAGITYRYFRVSFWPLAGLFVLITASHGILDALTNGGVGIPLFWPFDAHRFGPYGPIHVADIGMEFPDPRTSRAIRSELLYVWTPTLAVVAVVVGYRWWKGRVLRKGQALPDR
jgi:inner membrane protein